VDARTVRAGTVLDKTTDAAGGGSGVSFLWRLPRRWRDISDLAAVSSVSVHSNTPPLGLDGGVDLRLDTPAGEVVLSTSIPIAVELPAREPLAGAGDVGGCRSGR